MRFCVKWRGRNAFLEAVADVSSPDQEVIAQNGPLPLEIGGKFTCAYGTVVIPYEIVPVVDGTRVRVALGAVPPKVATSVGKAWFEVMVMRVHALFVVARLMTKKPPHERYRIL